MSFASNVKELASAVSAARQRMIDASSIDEWMVAYREFRALGACLPAQ